MRSLSMMSKTSTQKFHINCLKSVSFNICFTYFVLRQFQTNLKANVCKSITKTFEFVCLNSILMNVVAKYTKINIKTNIKSFFEPL